MLLLAFSLLTGAAARADDANADAQFSAARAAFEAEDFADALRRYEQCLALGMNGPAIHYNIGVAAYRAGDLARAETAFREVARTPAMAPLADYNLGLIALKRGEQPLARRWFERAAHESTDERLTALAARRLEELPGATASAPGWLYARAGAGYDDNAALRSDSLNTPGSGEGDSFAELMASGSYAFLPSWRADAAAVLTRYASLDEFDQTAISLGAAYELPLGDWQVELGGYGTHLALGGDVYERSLAATAQTSRSFASLGTVRARLRLSSVDGQGAFSGLSGSRTEFGVQYGWLLRSLDFAVHARAEDNDSRDALFATRWFELGAEARWAMNPLWSFLAGGGLRRTHHPAQSTQQARDDRRCALRLEATRTLWKRAQLYLRFEHERNASDVDAYQYARNWVAASIEIWR